MDFTKYGLEGEMLAKATADYEADVLGLKSKNTELIGREIKLKADIEALTLESATKENQAAIDLAEKNNDLEAYKAAVDEKENAITALKLDFSKAEEGRLLEGELNNFSTKLIQDPAARSYMQSKFKESIEFVEGQLKPKDPTKTIEQLAESLISDKANANYILQSVGSGAGSVGSESNGNVPSGEVNKAAEEAKSNGDLVGFLQASIKGK